MKLLKQDLERALGAMAKQSVLFTPAVQDGIARFVRWDQNIHVELNLTNTILPPKDLLFPQTEKMYHYHTGPVATVEEYDESLDQIIFGIRPCDVHAVACMDLVFLTKGYVDSFYERKRKKLTMVAIGCAKTAPTCFCQSMGLDPGAATEADLFLTPTQDGWNVAVQSPKGKALAQRLKDVFTQGNSQPLPKAECTLQVELEGVAKKLPKLFDSPLWDEIYRPCLGCGTCTYVCPTCYCFDMNTEQSTNEGTAFRCWDSCMFSEYSRLAGGSNPRPSKKERLRNRYMHKLAFFEERYGKTLCAGCGRCLEKCPVGMDITHVIDLVREAKLK